MDDEEDGEDIPYHNPSIVRRLISFLNLLRRFREKFPRKGSLNWVIKHANLLSKTECRIVIEKGEVDVFLPAEKYKEDIKMSTSFSLIEDEY